MTLSSRHSPEKAVRHYAIVDWDDALGLIRHRGPAVVELMPDGPRVRRLMRGERWTHETIPNVHGARRRLLLLLRSPARLRYDPLANNCEHVARYVAFGGFRSEQVRGAITIVLLCWGLIALARQTPGMAA